MKSVIILILGYSPMKVNKFVIPQTIEMIEKEQREAERRPITKITHKGEIEIESQEPVKAPEPVEVRDTQCHSAFLCIYKLKVSASVNFFFPLLPA